MATNEQEISSKETVPLVATSNKEDSVDNPAASISTTYGGTTGASPPVENSRNKDPEKLTEQKQQIPKVISINHYNTKKTVAHAVTCITVLTANASQIRQIILSEKSEEAFYWPLLGLMISSLALQIITLIILLIAGKSEGEDYEVNEGAALIWLDKLTNVLVAFCCLSALLNIFITTFVSDIPISNQSSYPSKLTG
ncbi:ninjurin-1-like [Tubulanus polymorphus]|uniref:ninjurin-1-like n=1 Tax=Tubulanus polymorphus TaxID=672921 RepID=UPI003DA41887